MLYTDLLDTISAMQTSITQHTSDAKQKANMSKFVLPKVQTKATRGSGYRHIRVGRSEGHVHCASHVQEQACPLGLLVFSRKTLSASSLAALSAAVSRSMASANDDVLVSKSPFTPEDEVGEASPAPTSMEEEWV